MVSEHRVYRRKEEQMTRVGAQRKEVFVMYVMTQEDDENEKTV